MTKTATFIVSDGYVWEAEHARRKWRAFVVGQKRRFVVADSLEGLEAEVRRPEKRGVKGEVTRRRAREHLDAVSVGMARARRPMI